MDTDILDAVQEAYSVFNSLGSLAGDKAIISGCVEAGNNVSDGVIYLNGEILSFKGGTLGTSIIIKEDTESRVFEDGATKPVIFKRYATFGSSTPEKTFVWADFKRFDNLVKNAEKNLDFEKRLKALETKKSPIPIGLIAIWGKPATEPIPEGWQECTDLRGRFPLGWNPDDEDFNTLLKEGGEKEHTLKQAELPNYEIASIDLLRAWTPKGGGFRGSNDNKLNYEKVKINLGGGNQPHNNMPPYRIIKFIEFVGFN